MLEDRQALNRPPVDPRRTGRGTGAQSNGHRGWAERSPSAPYSPPQSAIVTWGLIGIGVCLAMLALLGSTDRATLAWWMLIFVIALPLLIDKLLFRRTIDVFEPHFVSSLMFLAVFAGPSAGTVFWDVQYPLLPYVDLVPGIVLEITALLCLYGGYYATRYFQRHPSTDVAPSVRVAPLSQVAMVTIAGSYSIATILSILLFWLPLYGGLEGYLAGLYGFGVTDYELQSLGYQRALLFMASSAFHIAFVNAASRRGAVGMTGWAIVVVTGLVSSIAMILVGSRALLLWNIGVPLVIWHYQWRRISLSFAAICVVTALGVIVYYTDTIRSPGSVGYSPATALSETVPFYVTQTGEPYVVADLIERQPSTLTYQYGGTIVAAMMNPIPRALYPGKPPTAGELYTRYYHETLWRNGVAYMGMPWLGELYMNGGQFGVVLGMVLTGVAWGWLYGSFRRHPSPRRAYAYAIATFSLYFLISRGTLQAISYPLLWFIFGWSGLLIAERRFMLHANSRRRAVSEDQAGVRKLSTPVGSRS